MNSRRRSSPSQLDEPHSPARSAQKLYISHDGVEEWLLADSEVRRRRRHAELRAALGARVNPEMRVTPALP